MSITNKYEDHIMSLLQKGMAPDTGQIVWVVLGDDYSPIQPIQQYLNNLINLERSPNTIHSYAQYLKFYWDYLQDQQLDWRNVSIYDLSEYIH